MRKLKQFLSLSPAPVFFILGILSIFHGSHVCGFHFIMPEMAWMWFIMSAAHILPWILWWEQRRYRYSQSTLPVKQQ
jgi:hypothetical protein